MSEELNKNKVAIGGWLVPIGIAVSLMGGLGALSLVVEVLKLFLPIPTTTTPLVTVVGNIQSVVSILLLVLFVMRKRIFVKLFVWALALTFLYGIYFAVAVPHSKVSLYADLVYMPLYVISVIYLLRSKRVENTFVR